MSESDNDKTVFQARKPDPSDDEKTILMKNATDSRLGKSDKTQFKSRQTQSDNKTRFKKKTNSKDISAALSDSKVFSSLSPEEQKRVALLAAKRKREANIRSKDTQYVSSDNSDATRFSAPIREPIAKEKNNSANQKQSESNLSGIEDVVAVKNDLLKDRFILEEILGAGGMGVVYKAKDKLKIEAQDRDPYVAIKVLGDEFKSHPEAFIALQRESRKTQRIAHPNIVNVYDFDRDGDTVFMTMEYMEGEPLDKIIAKYKDIGLPEDLCWSVLDGLSAALIHAHKEHIIHSDFKPGNIFVTSKGTAKVFDFGIARAVAKAEHVEDEGDKTVFDAGDLGALTPAYASLEMLEGETPDVRDDIYALGCIAYELFTGSHPYNRVHANEAKKRGLQAKRIPNITKRQWKVIQSAIAFDRENRIPTVGAFWSELTFKKRSSLKIIGFILVFVSATSGGAYYLYLQQDRQPLGNEAELRTEIEIQLRIEEAQKNIQQWMTDPAFDSRSQEMVLSNVQELRKRMSERSPWLLASESKIFTLYMQEIELRLQDKQFDTAKALLLQAQNYSDDDALIATKIKQIDAAKSVFLAQAAEEEKQRLLEQQAQRQQKTTEQIRQKKISAQIEAFDIAIATVDKQLKCRRNIDMSDLGIAVGKLRELNMRRYQKQEPRIIASLLVCITDIGKKFPERAEEYKARAKRIFPGNNNIKNLAIIARDPCNKSIAGLGARGARAVCYDRLKSYGRGPVLVVVPAKGSLRQFAISKYEISIADWKIYCSATKSCQRTPKGADYLPVTNISLAEVIAYTRWLSNVSGKAYRLPSAVEWSYAAKANSNTLDANRNCRLDSRGIKKGISLTRIDIGTQNKWGLVGYVGNAQEWVQMKGKQTKALGGSYKTEMDKCTISTQVLHDGQKDEVTGFRVLRETPS